MSHESDNGVTEPLLPAHSKGRSNSLSSSANGVYDRNTAEHVERGDVHVKRNRPLRDSYLKQLGYTPLIFKVNSFLWRKMKKIGSFIASMSPMRARKPNDDLLSDAFPYHQSIIPSKGSIRGSVFNLAGATLGAGALSLPYAVAVSGLGFAVAQLVLASVLTVYTIRLLIRAEDITKLKSYEDLAMYCFGTKMTIFVEVNILIFCFGISVAYLVTLGDIITPLGELCFGMQSIFAQRWVLMTLSCGTIMLPLSLMKDISSLQFSSILGVLSIIFLVVAVAIRSIMYTSANGIPKDISWTIDLSRGPDFMLSVPIVMFAFTCQVNVFSIYTELQRPCIRRMNKVVDRATLISFLIYLSIGVVAYLAFGPQLVEPKYKGNILLSFPMNDTLIAISRAAITFTVAVAFPLNIFPCRFTIDMMFFSNSEDSWTRHVAVTSSLVLLALLLAIFCPSINVVFGIIGGTCSTVVCFCFPAAFILKLEDGPLLGPKKIGPVLLFVGAIVIGFVGTGVTVWSSLLMPPAFTAGTNEAVSACTTLPAMDTMGVGARNVAAEDGTEVQTCLYCANLKVLRDLLPPKRCDYCRKWRCQFCTLKFPLLGVRRGLPKVLKGNSRICIQCFGQIWQESEGSSPDTPPRLREDSHRMMHPNITQNRGRESRGVSFGGRSSMIESGRRGSMVDSESTMGSSRRSSMMRSSMMDSSRRGSMLESERRESMMVDQVWTGADSFTDPRRLSFMDSSNDNDLAKRPTNLNARPSSGGLSYRVASFLGFVASDGSDGTSMNAAIGLWMSLFAASILLVVALADGFSLHQRLCYCVATYGIFLTLHPWIHSDRQSSGSSRNLGDARWTAKPSTVAPQTATPVKTRCLKSSVMPESGSIPVEYKARIQEMDATLAYYLSDESPWKLVKAIRGSEIYELAENKTPFAIFKIEVFITGISMARFMAFLDSKDPRDRGVWDFNEANFEVIETFNSSDLNDDADVSVLTLAETFQ
uniref:Amino acid transporter transmembrane domain-containing protein n=1 Tax=Phytophthora ramorum TaxID=164328 RepID=H3GW21_PHYRM